jgi:hypothetical protein
MKERLVSEPVVNWIAAALSQFREPVPGDAPPNATAELAEVISFSAPSDSVEDFIQQLRAAIVSNSEGQVVVQEADPREFKNLIRGPALYLRLFGQRRIILTPSASPVLFDN